MRTLHFYNTLTRQKEPFAPMDPALVRMYVCGPTVYDHAHLGHAKSYVSFDVIRRYLRYLGYRVRYVQNITDVGHLMGDTDEGEDKLILAARRERLEPMEVAEKYFRSFTEDMDRLGVLPPDIQPRASGHIPEQIELIELLLERGYAYVVNGSVYFDVSRDPDYGKLSGRRIEELLAGSREGLEGLEEKRHPADFALWKRAEPGHLLRWRSPWGIGYPGWHIECSAMSMRYLGPQFDIHGGGLENQFPHHECEIAQSESATGQEPFVRYWLHNNMVTVGGQKMGKSLGNAISLKQLFSGDHPLLERGYAPQVVRFFILQSHYRSPLDFSNEALKAAERGWDTLSDAVRLLQEAPAGEGASVDTEAYRQRLEAAMNDDCNTAQALAVLFELLRDVRSRILAGEAPGNLDQVRFLVRTWLGEVLGLWPEPVSGREAHSRLRALVELVLELRQHARRERQWALADAIRDRLTAIGIEVQDTPQGPVWRFRP
jgi:cysteinyl-tRNA synthetase|nr:MAG: cysteine--tRNA ligase [Bacteroidota bacterium]